MSRVFGVLALALLLAVPLSTQNPGSQIRRPRQGTGIAQATQTAPAIQRVADINFELIHRAMSRLNFEATQLRRVRDGSQQGDWLEIRERVLHDLDANGEERFRLEYLEPQGNHFSRQQLLSRHGLYSSRAGFLYSYQSFRVHDVAEAKANYRIYPFMRTQRLGRTVERVVVYPVRWDRSIWLLDLDTETGYPLYCGEYNNRIQLLSEVVVEEFKIGSVALTSASQWRPKMLVTPYDSIDIALRDLGNRSRRMIHEDVQGLPPGYDMPRTQVVEDFLGEESLVRVFSDGIDNVFLIQTSGVDSMFDQLGISSTDTNTIAEYRDLNVAQYAFHFEDVRFLIVGRSSLTGLRATVEAVYRQAVR